MTNSLKASAFSAMALTFASFGDAFLYPFLPLNNNLVGVPAIWIGVLLSINRFVRILSNAFMVHVFATYGLRKVMIFAAIAAIISTAGYAIASGVFAWLAFRILWGLSFSAMRIGTLGYSLQHSKRGAALGISRSLQEAGPMLALFFAPLLLNYFEVTGIFFLLAGLSLPALWFAWKLPRTDDRTQPVRSNVFLRVPSVINSVTLLSAILIDGVVVVVLGILFLRYHEGISLVAATSLAAFYLGYRRICLVALSPAGGWIADSFGLEKVFNISLAAVILGLIVLLSGWVATGSVLVFTFYSINAAITPGLVVRDRLHPLAAVAENTTWRDIGAAIGTLTGGIFIFSPHLELVLLIAMIGLSILLLTQWKSARRAFKFLYLWR